MIFLNKKDAGTYFVGIDGDNWNYLRNPIREIMEGLNPRPYLTNKYKLLLPKEMVLWDNTQE